MIKSLRLEMKSLKGSEASILNELGYKTNKASDIRWPFGFRCSVGSGVPYPHKKLN